MFGLLRPLTAAMLLAELFVAAPSKGPLPAVSLDEYRNRRQALAKTLDGPFVLMGVPGSEEERMREGLFQDSYFYYLSGWNYPDARMIVTATEEILFIPKRNSRHEHYYGHRAAPEDADATKVTGFFQAKPLEEFEGELARLAGTTGKVYVTNDAGTAETVRRLLTLRPRVQVVDGSMKINVLRMVKSDAEQALVQNAVDQSVAAHFAAWGQIEAGKYEYQIAMVMRDTWGQNGCEREAYPPIIGSGPNANLLHYWEDKRRMDSGEVIVMDAAAECSGYAADITRTVPVNGKFTARQREIYDIVYEAQKAAIDAVKPGAYTGNKERKGSIWNIAYEYMNTHGKDLHGKPLGEYTIHGVSHHVGLDVHDPADYDKPLGPGMIVTVEPGIYIPEENIGFRIEDMVLVTETGHRLMTQALPRSADEVEKAMAEWKRPSQ
jgi:Xaa-Pro aminopeptidase